MVLTGHVPLLPHQCVVKWVLHATPRFQSSVSCLLHGRLISPLDTPVCSVPLDALTLVLLAISCRWPGGSMVLTGRVSHPVVPLRDGFGVFRARQANLLLHDPPILP